MTKCKPVRVMTLFTAALVTIPFMVTLAIYLMLPLVAELALTYAI